MNDFEIQNEIDTTVERAIRKLEKRVTHTYGGTPGVAAVALIVSLYLVWVHYGTAVNDWLRDNGWLHFT